MQFVFDESFELDEVPMSEDITSEDLEEHERMIEKQSNAFANFGKEY